MLFYERLVKNVKHKKRTVLSAILCFVLMINGAIAKKVQATNIENEEIESGIEVEIPLEEKVNGKNDWSDGPDVIAGSAVVMDVDTGLVLYEKNSTETNYPASITKILTALVAIENASLSDTVTFSKEAVFSIERGSSSCAIDWGEELSLEDCLYGLLLESGNDAANGIAEHVGGTIADFVDMMNQKVSELGCVNSHFGNAHGLSQDDHYTCAYDMALISRAAIRNSQFAKITGTRRHVVEPTNKQEETRYWLNHHKFVNKEKQYDGCIGGKTGYTQKSKNTLVTFAKRGDMTLVCVVMNDNADGQYTDTAKLLDYGFDNFTIYHMEEAESSKLLEEKVFFSQYSTVLNEENPLLFASEDTYVILPNDVKLDQVKRSITYHSAEQMKDTAAQIQEIGTICYEYGNQVVGEGKILMNLTESRLPATIHETMHDTASASTDSKKETEESTSSKEDVTIPKEKKNLKPVIAAIIAILVVAVISLYYVVVERPRKRRRKAYLERRRRRNY